MATPRADTAKLMLVIFVEACDFPLVLHQIAIYMLKAIVIGGGIGGLSTAAALERVGIECHVYEQAAELREVGAGLTIWANATRALQQLGCAESLLPLGS